MVSRFLPSASSPSPPFRWTCDRAWDKRTHNTTTCATTFTKHVNHMTSCSFPPPRTSQLQAVEQSEKSDCLARCASFTKRATPDPALLAFLLPPTTGHRSSSGASSTSSSRRSRPSRSPPRAASAADGLVIGDGTKRNRHNEERSPHSLRHNCHKARLGRAAPTTARSRWDRPQESRTSASRASPRCSSPAGKRTRGTGRARHRPPPGHL